MTHSDRVSFAHSSEDILRKYLPADISTLELTLVDFEIYQPPGYVRVIDLDAIKFMDKWIYTLVDGAIVRLTAKFTDRPTMVEICWHVDYSDNVPVGFPSLYEPIVSNYGGTVETVTGLVKMPFTVISDPAIYAATIERCNEYNLKYTRS